jgi:hypothetical protein
MPGIVQDEGRAARGVGVRALATTADGIGIAITRIHVGMRVSRPRHRCSGLAHRGSWLAAWSAF